MVKKLIVCIGITGIAMAADKKEEQPFIELIADYQVQDPLKPTGLKDISQKQIDEHWALYKGYVTQVNALNKELAELRAQGKGASADYADRRRRYGFEYNGMVLHEYYFANLKANGKKEPEDVLKKALANAFGSYDAWHTDFINAGKTRGIGWVLLCMDMTTKQLINIFVADHEIGTIASFAPILVMDIWEHAYMVDHGASGRPDYITAFMANIDWNIVLKRYNDALEGKVLKRF